MGDDQANALESTKKWINMLARQRQDGMHYSTGTDIILIWFVASKFMRFASGF